MVKVKGCLPLKAEIRMLSSPCAHVHTEVNYWFEVVGGGGGKEVLIGTPFFTSFSSLSDFALGEENLGELLLTSSPL